MQQIKDKLKIDTQQTNYKLVKKIDTHHTSDKLVDDIFDLIQVARGDQELQVAHAEQELQSVFKLATYVLSWSELYDLFDRLFHHAKLSQLEIEIRWCQYCHDTTYTPSAMMLRTFEVMRNFTQLSEINTETKEAIKSQITFELDKLDPIISRNYGNEIEIMFEMAISLINLCIHNNELKKILRNILEFTTLEEVRGLYYNLSPLSPCGIRRREASTMSQAFKFTRFEIWGLRNEQVFVILNDLVLHNARDLFLEILCRLDLTQINDDTIGLCARFFDLTFDTVQTYVRMISLSLHDLKIIPIEFIRGEQFRSSDKEFQRFVLANALSKSYFLCEELNLCLLNLTRRNIIEIIRFWNARNVRYYLITQFLVVDVRDLDRLQLDICRIIRDAEKTNYLKFWNGENMPFMPIVSSSMVVSYLISNPINQLVNNIFNLIQVARDDQELQSVLKLAACVLSLQQLEVLFDLLFPNPNDPLKIRWYQYCYDATYIPFVMFLLAFKIVYSSITFFSRIAHRIEESVKRQIMLKTRSEIFRNYEKEKQIMCEMSISLINLCMHDDNFKKKLKDILAFATLEKVIDFGFGDYEFIDFYSVLHSLSPCKIHRLTASSMFREFYKLNHKLHQFQNKLNRFEMWALSDEQVSTLLGFSNFVSERSLVDVDDVSGSDVEPFLRYLDSESSSYTTPYRLKNFLYCFCSPFDASRPNFECFLRCFSRLNLTQINYSTIESFHRRFNLDSDVVQTYVQMTSLPLDYDGMPQFIRGEQLRNSNAESQRHLFLTDNILSLCRIELEELNLLFFSCEEILSIMQFWKARGLNYCLVTQFFVIDFRCEYFDRLDLGHIIQDALDRNYLKLWNVGDAINFPITDFSILKPYLKSEARAEILPAGNDRRARNERIDDAPEPVIHQEQRET